MHEISCGWIIKDNILVNINEENLYIPTAEEIYSAVFEGAVPNNHLSKECVNTLKSAISFSKYPADIKLILENEKEKVRVSIEVQANETNINIPYSPEFPDHFVIGKKWYPYSTGIIAEIKKIASEFQFDENGEITFGNYFKMLRKPDIDFIIKNRIKAEEITFSSFSGEHEDPQKLKAKLYPYQKDGWKWLQFMFKEQLGGVLADEMGLGKTIQIIALFTSEPMDRIFPSLIIAPSTLLENWKREIAHFAPHIGCSIHQGSGRTGFPNELKKNNVVITSYDTAVRDSSLLREISWKIIVCDEAQAIKNPDSKRARVIKNIPRSASFAVTGTPIENRLQDLWSIMDFAIPEYLGRREDFYTHYEQQDDGPEQLEAKVTPVILRRRVKDVAKDLPARIEIPQIIEMLYAESELYEKTRDKTIKEYKKNSSLVVLSRLRMLCTHPALLSENFNDNPEILSTKYQRLIEIADEIISNGAKMLVFTSFQRMTDIIVSDFRRRFGIYTDFIDGRTAVSERQGVVDKFSIVPGSGILVLNPRAAGAGLNITAANHVIHYNPEWNPAIEDQASARAYRRGQDRPVTIHRLIYANTIEEVMDERLQRKRKLAETALIGSTGEENYHEDILRALAKSPQSRK